MVNCLVTGGAGFIGSNLAERLINDGHSVTILDNLSTGKIENIKDFIKDVSFLAGDITNLSDCKLACKDIDIVFHQAALGSVPRSVDNPIASNKANVDGTLNMLYAAKEKNVKRFIYAGSSSAYGDNPSLPKKEDMVLSPISPYAISKLTGEYYCRVFYKEYGLETISLRYFNVFGPRQDPGSQYSAVLPAFITAVLDNVCLEIYGDGEQTRDFSHIDNVVEANVLAAITEKTLTGETVNIACGQRVSLNEIIEKLEKIFDKKIDVGYGEKRKGDVEHTLASIDKAEKIIGYKPSVFFDEGLIRTVKWYEDQKSH